MNALLSPQTPVLVGVGVATSRQDDHANAPEALALMLSAVRAAGQDCGKVDLLAEVDSIAVPRGRWRYRNPSGATKRAIGAENAKTIVSSVGVLQQTLIADACERIAKGEIWTALVAGADAGHRLLRAKIAGLRVEESVQDDEPDVRLEPASELRHPAETKAGLQMPVGLYALIESARRARAGLSVDAHLDRLAAQAERFAAIAARNPHAWDRSGRSASALRDAGPRNPMQAFPYTRAHCSTWNVDQAAALLFCSLEKAQALGLDPRRWVFPLASAESNHMATVSERADLASSPGAEAAARAVFDDGGVNPADVDLVDLYSCFPAAIDTFAEAAHLPKNRDLTITGGMAFAGGPYNNYVLQATARAAELLREGAGKTALISCVSGILTKQAFALWSTQPPTRGFVRRDVTTKAAANAKTKSLIDDFQGEGVVAGCTTIYGRDTEPYAVVLIDVGADRRALATSRSPEVISGIEREEWVGRTVRVANGEFST